VTQRRDLILLALLALFTNFTYFAFSDQYTFPDSATYLTPAQNLLHGRGFTGELGFPETIRTPVYPLFLIPFIAATASLAPIVVVQHLMNVALVIAIYLFARRRFHRFVAVVAAIIFAIDTPTIHYANKVLTETLFTAGLFAILWLLSRTKSTAILTSLLVLLRPLAIFYFAILAFFVPRRAIALFTALSLALPIAWGIRNRIATGVFTISSIAGVNMLLHRAAGTLAILDAGDFKQDLGERQQELLDDANDDLANRYHIDDAMDLDPAIRGAYYAQVGRRIALQHPAGLALLTARGLLVNLFDSDWESMMIVSNLDSSLIRFALNAWTHAVILFAIIGLVVMWNRDRNLAILLATTIAYFLLISAGGESEARFRVPVVPQLAIAAAFGVDAIRRAASPAPR